MRRLCRHRGASRAIYVPKKAEGLIQSGFTLQDVNLSIGDEEFFALLGPTGSGKTLMLEATAEVLSTSGGRICINGYDVSRLPPERRRTGINVNAFWGTIHESIEQGYYHKIGFKVDEHIFRAILPKRDFIDLELHKKKEVCMVIKPSAIHVF